MVAVHVPQMIHGQAPDVQCSLPLWRRSAVQAGQSFMVPPKADWTRAVDAALVVVQ
jgi:hypothetical protein